MLNKFLLTRALSCYISKNMGYSFSLPLSVVFAITLKCNSKCKTCFIWKNPQNQDNELTVDEYKRIFQSMGRLYWVTFGGGEPFLRGDFVQIILDACRFLKPAIVNIPSNGSRPQEIFDVMDKVTQRYPETKFILNLSLDHIAEKHDMIRGMQGSFDLACKTINDLSMIKRRNFNLGVHTVISKYNLNDFPFIYEWISKNLSQDSYIIENAQVREEYMNHNEAFFSQKSDYAKAIEFYLNSIKKVKMLGINKLRRAFRITYYESVLKSLLSASRPYDCYAGYASCQVSPDGEVLACATKGLSLGNLREFQYNLKILLRTKEAKKVRLRIKREKCFCNLSNVSYSNILFNPGKLVASIYNYVRY